LDALLAAPAGPAGTTGYGPAYIVPGARGWCDDAAEFPENARDPRFVEFERQQADAVEGEWPAALRARVQADRVRLAGQALPLSATGGAWRSAGVPSWNRLSLLAVPITGPVEDTANLRYNGLVRRCAGNKYPTLTFRTGDWLVVVQGMCWHGNADWTALTRALDARYHPTWLAGNFCGGETMVQEALFTAAGISPGWP
jgi:hypothetical protein